MNEPVECTHGGIHEHGTTLMYVVDKCRCTECSDDHNTYLARRRQMIRLGTWRNQLQPVQPLRKHLELLRRHGIGSVQLCKLTGLSDRVFWRINFGPDDSKVQARTARKILAVQPDYRNSSPGTWTNAAGTRRRLQALIAVGWSQTVLTRELGLSEGCLRRIHTEKTVRARTAIIVAEHYDRLWNQPVPPSRMKTFALRMARERGYYPPLAWDDDEIDDPQAKPHGEWKAVA